jgi:hypothetical protein
MRKGFVMRKRITIALLAIVLAVAVGIIVTNPRKGSLAWHKKEYFACFPRQGVVDVLGQLVGKQPLGGGWAAWTPQKEERMKFHEKALIKMGYLEEWTFVLSNQPPTNVLNALSGAVGATGPRHVWFDPPGTNTIRFVTIKGDTGARVSQWEQALRQVDVP